MRKSSLMSDLMLALQWLLFVLNESLLKHILLCNKVS